MADDDLADFQETTFTFGGKTRTIFRKGEGPAVIVMAEIPGITPKVAGFARKVADIGCTAVMPHLFGEPGRDPSGASRGASMVSIAKTIGPLCVSREFTMWAANKTSPVVEWLRALADHEHEVCGGPGVGAIGMCFTGGYALAMATHPNLLAPVLSQPSMPATMTAKQRRSIDCSPEDLAVVKDRCASEGLQVLGLRFKGDRFVPPERFGFLREQLGDAFVAVELEDEDGNPDADLWPHSVVTEHLIDEEGQPTYEALGKVLDLFRTRLLVDA